MRDILISEYQAAVAMADVPDELKRALKTDSRVPGFIDNLHRELTAVPPRFRNELVIRNTVKDLTNLFLSNVKRMADERAMTHAAKQAIKDNADKAAKQDAIVSDMMEGKDIDAERIAEVADDE